MFIDTLKEIDDHYKFFKKFCYEIDFDSFCEICNKPVDQNGFCSCGTGGAE
ncbi:MAG: hypothetical protein R3321_02545 [Nitrososphaeraceae archaeon]|nr:hypothetical protein [Nitrososphaeraceae archaeon]